MGVRTDLAAAVEVWEATPQDAPSNMEAAHAVVEAARRVSHALALERGETGAAPEGWTPVGGSTYRYQHRSRGMLVEVMSPVGAPRAWKATVVPRSGVWDSHASKAVTAVRLLMAHFGGGACALDIMDAVEVTLADLEDA